MKKFCVVVVVAIFVLLPILSVTHVLITMPAEAQEEKSEKASGDEGMRLRGASEESLKEIETAKEKEEKAKTEFAVAEKTVKVQKKEEELEKKKAEAKRKEAEIAKKEAELAQQTAGSKKEIREAIQKAQQKEKEAVAALEKVKLAEEKTLAAEERAQLAEEELKITEERATIAEGKLSEKRKEIYRKLIHTIAIILLGYLLIFVIIRIINRRIEDIRLRHSMRKNIVYIINFLMIIYVIFLWVQNLSSITIIFSALGAGLIVTLQGPILCIAGWLFILVRRPFEVGDRIELGGVKGDVIDIRLFQTSLLEIENWVEADQSTGRIVNVPNSTLFSKANYNYSRGFEFIWNEIRILVTFESDWKRGKEIMTSHGMKVAEGMENVVKGKIRGMTRKYMIRYEKLTPIVYVNIKDSGVELTLRYLTEARKRRSTQDALCQAILDDFEKEEKVNFAYPTYRIVK